MKSPENPVCLRLSGHPICYRWHLVLRLTEMLLWMRLPSLLFQLLLQWFICLLLQRAHVVHFLMLELVLLVRFALRRIEKSDRFLV